VGLVIALIVVTSMKKKLTSVQYVNQANNYIRPGSMVVTGSNEVYLYSNVTRTVRQSSSSSGGGGSHTSSSGASHGGGGGKF
ncbi:MAG: TPM domain-containing protein, partial [Clostridia bacterium]|nr:TPM domain-containing protein [Clostridia bacterium]